MLSRWHEDLAAHDEAFACLQDLLDPSSFATTVVKAFREWGQGPRQIRSNFRRWLAAFNHGAPACVGTLEPGLLTRRFEALHLRVIGLI